MKRFHRFHYSPKRTSVPLKILKAAGLTSTRIAGRLPLGVVQRIPLPETVRDVSVSSERGFHLSSTRGDLNVVRWCVDNMRTVIEQPTHLDTNPKPPSVCGLMARITREKGLYIAIKHVTPSKASSGTDELWIQTMHPLGRKRWPRYLRKCCVIEVDELIDQP